MTFDEAAKTVIPFGMYKGQTIDKIARDDQGLLYLDRIRGWEAIWPRMKEAIDVYLGHDPIARDLELAIEKKSKR